MTSNSTISMPVNVNDLEDIVCPCGCSQWIVIHSAKLAPALLAPSGREEVILGPPGMSCVQCKAPIAVAVAALHKNKEIEKPSIIIKP